MATLDVAAALRARGYATDTPAGLKGAVMAFQRAAGLKVDGIAGDNTKTALGVAIGAKPAVASAGPGIAGLLTTARLLRMEPKARPAVLTGMVASVAAIEGAGITDANRLCHFLAQVAHESQGFTRTEENLLYTTAERIREVWPSRFPTVASALPFVRNPQALACKVYGGRLGNAASPTLDGWMYRGSGGLGTTGKANFAEVGAADDPDRLRRPEGFLAPALHYWTSRGCNALADADNITGVTLKINGGQIGLADRRARLAAARRAFA